MSWYSQIESTVFTQIKYMLALRENAPFPSLNCKTTGASITPAQFPTLYLHETQKEVGQDLENNGVNAVESKVYIRVWTNTTEYDCKKILTAATEELKRLRYNVSTLPSTNISSKVAFGEIIGIRLVGAEDKITK